MTHAAPNSRNSASQAAAALLAGGLVILRTETTYGIAANAASAASLKALRAARNSMWGDGAGGGASTLHLHEFGREYAAKLHLHPAQLRIVRKLLPGPITLQIEGPPIEAALGAIEGSFQAGGVASFRVPSDPTAHEVLVACAAAGVPVVAEGLPAAGGVATTLQQALDAARVARVEIAATAGDGETQLRRPSAVLRFFDPARLKGPATAASLWRLVEPGPFDPAYIERAAERSVLFVCTGNTCRSPMAEGIARVIGASDPLLKINSAGVGAFDGAGYSPEAVEAVLGLELRGILTAPAPAARLESWARGRSRVLTGAMVEAADEIYVMTRSHRAAVVAMDPRAAGKVQLVDPEGRDVADPIGSDQARYDAVAGSLVRMIRTRLQEDRS